MSTLKDETLSDLLKLLWTARLYLLIGGIIGFIAATIMIYLSIPHMRSLMVVAPAAQMVTYNETTSGNELQHSPNETLAFLQYLKILSGPNVVSAVLKANPDLKNKLSQSRRFTFQTPKVFKGADDLSLYLSKNIVIKPVGDTPLRTIILEHPNPMLAQNLLIQLHNVADTVLRKDLLERTNNRLEYLKQTLGETANPEHRAAITNLLIEQERLAMMIRMDRYYAAALVEPPYIHPKPVWPRKSYIFPLCVMVGMMMGWVIFGVKKSYE